MSGNKTKYVGAFRDTKDLVPPKYQGKKIYYSETQNLFAIVDENNVRQKIIDFDFFRKFEDADLVMFNGTMKQYLDERYDFLQNRYSEEDEEDADYDEYDDYMYEEEPPAKRRRVNGRKQDKVADTSRKNQRNKYRDDSAPVEHDIEDIAFQKAKDPTKHLFGFFVTVFVIAMIAIIIKVFGITIVSQLQQLL